MKINSVCPLGSECETAKDGHINRCSWYMEVAGKNPQTDEVYKKHECAITLNAMLLIENTREVSMLNGATNSFRHEMKERQDLALKIALNDKPDILKIVKDA